MQRNDTQGVRELLESPQLALQAASRQGAAAQGILEQLFDAGVDFGAIVDTDTDKPLLTLAHSSNLRWLHAHGCQHQAGEAFTDSCRSAKFANRPQLLSEFHERIRVLLELGVDVNYRDPNIRRTPLMWITDAGSTSDPDTTCRLTQMLLEAGARTDVRETRSGRNLLACSVHEKNMLVVALLLKHGAPIERDCEQEEWLVQTAVKVDCVQVLAELAARGVDFNPMRLNFERNGHTLGENLPLVDLAIEHDASHVLSWLLDNRVCSLDDIAIEPYDDKACAQVLRSLRARRAAHEALEPAPQANAMERRP